MHTLWDSGYIQTCLRAIKHACIRVKKVQRIADLIVLHIFMCDIG